MNRKAFIEEVNPAFVALALIGAGAVWYGMRATNMGLRIFGTIIGFIVIYFYLVMTDG